jgi:protein-disulfide isomerase
MKMSRIAALVLASAVLLSGGAPTSTVSSRTAGNANAKVRIEVFSDFQCPSCKVLHEGTLRRVKANYVETGRIQMISRYFPLPMHQFARPAACLACASERIGKYGQVSDVLFLKQEQWSRDGNLAGVLAAVLSPAELEKVKKLAEEPSVKAEVDRDVAAGMEAHIGQTPTMIIYSKGNRYPIPGAVTYEVLERALNSLLAK